MVNLYYLAGIIVGVPSLSLLLFLAIRGGYYRSLAEQWREVAEQRKALADVRLDEIQELQRRVSELERNQERVQHENDVLRKLNLRYQTHPRPAV